MTIALKKHAKVYIFLLSCPVLLDFSIFFFSKYFVRNCKYQILAQTDNFDVLDKICQKRVFPVKNRKSEPHHCVLHIRISLGINLYLNLTTLPKRNILKSIHSHWICIFELFWVPNWQLTVYGPSRPRGNNKNAMTLLRQSRDS